MTVKGTLTNTILQDKDHEEGQMVWKCCDTVKGTLTNTILRGKDHEEEQMVWKCCDSEGNPGKHHLAG